MFDVSQSRVEQSPRRSQCTAFECHSHGLPAWQGLWLAVMNLDRHATSSIGVDMAGISRTVFRFTRWRLFSRHGTFLSVSDSALIQTDSHPTTRISRGRDSGDDNFHSDEIIDPTSSFFLNGWSRRADSWHSRSPRSHPHLAKWAFKARDLLSPRGTLSAGQ